jgi:hypothetical protein
MPRPKKIKIDVSENNEKVEELIDKIKSIYPKQAELIDQIIDNVNKDSKQKNILPIIVTDKIGNYYYDDYGGIWNNNFEWIGSYNDKNYFFSDIKKIKNKIDNKIVKFNQLLD